ncbi:PilZ domain-containing protein [Novosphingobium mangrovi (ex Huang et al. 2023)]|uniref:PilZ domain-containing protein n=1 Tax=Novosphingobium mangrovi (ex Huang et al. 2023) TaxID=2976432 RepID=A0ABT2I350_9SPHN|nr:PilZ domain-containing protein [Novosphingobium mangrovi (ex Huang et al. 2023)]MCT2399229.1 PilZ domain-containing protein [Novosphingobium mangrovi (ex Huang et al. 2023)]
MNEGDNRQIARDSLFLMADLRVDGLQDEYRIKVRNLSPGGMMGEGSVRVVRGTIVEVNIRNVGWVEGSVAWVQDTRFGVAFRDDIDPKLARAPVGQAEDPSPRFTRNHPAYQAGGSTLRKI